MLLMTTLPDASCKHCGGDIRYGTKDEVSSEKVFVDCADCGREAMAGLVDHGAAKADVLAAARRAPHVTRQ